MDKAAKSGNEVEAIKETFRYNSFVRKKYLDALGKLPKEELMRDRGASYPSMLDIFGHVLGAYAHWLMDIYPGHRTKEFEQLKDVQSLEDAREDEKLVDTYVMNFVEDLDEKKLDSTFVANKAEGKWRINLRQLLWHLVEEELQHRGELNALFWQLDVDPPVTGWLAWKFATGEIKTIS